MSDQTGQQVYHIHPLGWENDPDEERYRLSPLDYVGTCVFNNYALYFKLDDGDKANALEVLRSGLERTLCQTRHLSSTIEEGPDGDHWFVRRKENTVELRVQWLDTLEDEDKYPSLQDMEDAHFRAQVLGDLDLWQIPQMRYGGDNPEAHPDRRPSVLGFKASFVRGGLVLVTHVHHLANDTTGWASFIQQLAENCRASVTGTPYPPWDPACLVVARRLAKGPVPEDQKITAPSSLLNDPTSPLPLPGGRQALLFHLPKSKAAQLKALAHPPPSASSRSSTTTPITNPTNNTTTTTTPPTPTPPKISTYDATTALLWQILTRLRHAHYASRIPRSARPLWATVIDMRQRLRLRTDLDLVGVPPSPTIPARMQRNLLSAAVSRLPLPGVPEEDVWPLHRVAAWVRAMTEAGGTWAVLEALHDQFRLLRDKTRAAADMYNLPALAVAVSDHRAAAAVIGGGREGEGAEFGFGKPVAYRQLWGRVDVGLLILYPARAGSGEDEGLEFTIGYEKVLAKELVEDEEFRRWFEYRGVDWEDE
ncbi:uncharacterized protein B0H64DRAFT_357742 [Chaetomium fimeti]|uniref:Trichothecene 3-O-acetyltransferase-like N-terminal domain-containing protein n=1 Tax=Chaetomium fimeti TaxID=1854472 RepID=A0AAE0HJJ7_9PEZI|nr:hypothetical protein B0H64DRAFT_357742 [Chaetomium fimeti]